MGKGNKQVKAGEQTVINSLPDYARPYFENLMERAEAESLTRISALSRSKNSSIWRYS